MLMGLAGSDTTNPQDVLKLWGADPVHPMDTAYTKMAEKVLDMPSLGDRRPSQLLAAMLEFCPEGESDTSFFRASFFRRLPKEIRVLMADEVNGNLKEMAIRADELFQHHRSSVMATVSGGGGEEGDDGVNSAVAALNIKGKFQKKKTGL